MMKYLFFICSTLFCFDAKSDTSKDDQVDGLTIAAPEIRPFIYKNEEGENSGLFIDTIKQLNDSGIIKLSIEIMPWARALKEVKYGRFDALMPTVYNDERALFLSFPKEPIINFYGSEIFQRTDDTFEYKSITLIGKDKIIVKVRSTQLEEKLEQDFKDVSIKFVEVSSLEDAFNMLIYKHADLLVADSIIANSTIDQMAINNKVKGISIYDDVDSSFLAFSKKYAATHNINELMKIINTINDPDSFHYLSKK